VRDWLYVGDHCRAIMDVLDRGRIGEVYNIGGNSERRNLEVVERLCEILDELRPDAALGAHRSLISFVKDRPGHDHRYAIDSGKIQRELGWRPSVTFEEGLRRTVAWYLDHMDWVSHVRSGEYRHWISLQYGSREPTQ
jgi:dTDP-glucose 4,6-dehydratase